MPYGAWHVGIGAELNSTLPDLGHPEIPNLWNQLLADRPVRAGILECLASHDCPRWMFPVERAGRRYFAHYNPAEIRALATKGDEHQARQDYLCTRAEREGLAVASEVPREGGRRIDVRIGGQISVACEIQTSYIHEGTVARRVAVDMRNGDTPLWIANDPYSAAINRAPWSRVPKSLPHRIADGLDDMLLGGVMTAVTERCGRREPNCPVTKRAPCGQLHLYFEPARGVHLDHLAIGAATGQYRPTTRKVGHSLHHLWLPADDWERWNDQLAGVPDSEPERKAAQQQEPRDLDYQCRYGEDSGFRAEQAVPRDVGATVFAGTVPRPRIEVSLPSWRAHGVGELRACRVCGQPAMLRDECGEPCHKVCAEAQVVAS